MPQEEGIQEPRWSEAERTEGLQVPVLRIVPSGVNSSERTVMKPPKRNKSLVKAYLFEESLSGCELFGHLDGKDWDRTKAQWGITRRTNSEDFPLEPHHIFRGIHRWDIETNIVAICHAAHDYCTDKPWSFNGNVCALWVKAQKNQLDIPLMTQCFGMNPLAMVERWTLTESWAIEMRNELLERYAEL